ncbi:MAG: recombinase family protein [Bacteroidota bacterium]
MLAQFDLKNSARESVIYARVSSKEQEETGYSLPAQETSLREYAQRRGLVVTKAFSISESASGRKQREVFTELMDFVTKQRIKIIICEKVDRLTRNFKDAVMIDEWLEEDADRQVHLVKDSLVLHKNSRSQEKLNWGIRILFAKNYIDNLSEEVKKGLAEKLKQGWLPTKPPLGYKTVGEKGHKIHVIDEAKAPHLKKMFEHYATGEYSLSKLVKVMYEYGLRSRNGKRVVKSRMADLLSDPFYIGKIRYNNALFAGAHEPLVTPERFEKVHRILRGKAVPRVTKHSPLFRSLIRCATCNGLVTWEIQKGHWYGHCNGYRGCIVRKYVRQESVEEQLLPYIEKIAVRSPRLLEWIKIALRESHGDQIAYNSKAREELIERYEILQKRLERLYDDKIDQKIAEDFYRRKFEQYTGEKEEVLRGLKKHDIAGTQYHGLGADVLNLACCAKEVYLAPACTVENRRTLLSLIFSNISLNGDQISVSYAKAFEILAQSVPTWNATFEPQETRTKKTKTEAVTPVSASLLPGWDEFRMTRWSDLFEDPGAALEQINHLLALAIQEIKAAA